MSGDEIVKVEKVEIERFVALGLGRYEAIRAVEDKIDRHAVEALLRHRRAHRRAQPHM